LQNYKKVSATWLQKLQIALLMFFLFTQKQIDQIQANQQRKKQLSYNSLTA